MMYLDEKGKKNKKLAEATGTRLLIKLEKEIKDNGHRENQCSDYYRNFSNKISKYKFDYYNECEIKEWFRNEAESVESNLC